jgi:hypothetical protein
MPELTHYLQRVSFALRQGKPANDVAVLLPNDDVWASFKATAQKRSSPTSPAGFDESGSNVSIDESMKKFLGGWVVQQILDAGFNPDFIDADAIDSVGIPYKVLVLPNVDRLPVAAYEKILAFARRGGIVFATRRTPATAPGWMHAEQDTKRIREISASLFGSNSRSKAGFVQNEYDLGAALIKATQPDLKLSPLPLGLGFIHRKLVHGDLYFVANTWNQPAHLVARFRNTAPRAETWDPFTGKVTGLPDPKHIDLDLAPYESRLILFSSAARLAPPRIERRDSVLADLSQHWKVSFGSSGWTAEMSQLASWTNNPSTKFFSGVATYERDIDFPAGNRAPGARLLLDFGKVTAVSGIWTGNPSAYLDAPVRDAAEVFINGERAGIVWHPPYRIDVTGFLHAGSHHLRIVVGNTAINELAGQPLPDYRPLWARYGMRFVPQFMNDLHPLPSGLLGPVTLVESTPIQ